MLDYRAPGSLALSCGKLPRSLSPELSYTRSEILGEL